MPELSQSQHFPLTDEIRNKRACPHDGLPHLKQCLHFLYSNTCPHDGLPQLKQCLHFTASGEVNRDQDKCYNTYKCTVTSKCTVTLVLMTVYLPWSSVSISCPLTLVLMMVYLTWSSVSISCTVPLVLMTVYITWSSVYNCSTVVLLCHMNGQWNVLENWNFKVETKQTAELYFELGENIYSGWKSAYLFKKKCNKFLMKTTFTYLYTQESLCQTYYFEDRIFHARWWNAWIQ